MDVDVPREYKPSEPAGTPIRDNTTSGYVPIPGDDPIPRVHDPVLVRPESGENTIFDFQRLIWGGKWNMVGRGWDYDSLIVHRPGSKHHPSLSI